jgi:hypothetical protein
VLANPWRLLAWEVQCHTHPRRGLLNMLIARDGHGGGPSSPTESAPEPCQWKSPQSDLRYPTLHVIRALMGVAVFASHWSVPRYAMFIPQIQLPVDVFFSVEGFLAGSLAFSRDGSFGQWTPVIRRITAIYPLYVLGLISGLLVMYPLALRLQDGWSIHMFGVAAVRGLLMLPTFSRATAHAVYPFNSPSWAIVIETATFAVFWPLRGRLNVWALALTTFIAMALMLGLAIHWHDINMGWRGPGYWGGFPRVVFGFLSGALLFRIMQSTGPILPRWNPLIIFLVAGGILFLKVHLIGLPLLLVVVPLLTWSGAISAEPKWLLGLGHQADRHAYAIYLLAFPTVVACREIGASLMIPDTWLSGPVSFPALLCIVLLAAHIGTVANEHLRQA